ncbi:type II secretion system protein XpsH [Cognatilysobacter bugurensis]|uniref:type II secretion system protein XpsH n=1 Tax=Cognatilysobacter bugurensis TaxID=543356 RepID=UPI003CCDDF9B
MASVRSPSFARRRVPGSRGRSAARGVSLLEVLLVVALIAATSVLAAAALGGGFAGLQLRSSAKDIAAQLRFTRTHAIATGEPQRFVIDPGAHRWTAPSGRNGEIPEALGIRFFGARQVQPSRGEGAIVFFPDGASTGGRVQLHRDGAGWNVDVAWLTGRVKLQRAQDRP